MAYGTLYGSVGKNSRGYGFSINWSESNVNEAANTSYLTVEAYITANSGWSFYTSQAGKYLIVDNAEKVNEHSGVSCTAPTTIKVFEWAGNIEHDADGAKTLRIYAQLDVSVNGGPGTCVVDGYVTLDKILRNSTFSTSIQPFTFTGTESEGVVTISQPSFSVSISSNRSDVKHLITAEVVGSENTTYFTDDSIGAETSGSISIPSNKITSWLSAVPNSKTGSARIRLYTYIDNGASGWQGWGTDTKIGVYDEQIVTFNIDATQIRPYLKQDATFDLSDAGITLSGALAGKNIYLSGLSRPKISGLIFDGGTGSKTYPAANTCIGSQITRYKLVWSETGTVVADAQLSSGKVGQNGEYTITPAAAPGKRTIKLSVFDARGGEASVNCAVYMLQNYAAPSLSKVVAKRANSGGTPTDDGTYLYNEFSMNVYTLKEADASGSLIGDNLNTASVDLVCIDSEGSTQTASAVQSAAIVSGVSLLTDQTYTVGLTVTDAVGQHTQSSSFISSAFFTMHFKEGGHAVGIGTAVGSAVDDELHIGSLSVPWSVFINDEQMVDFVVAEGADNDWTYRKWHSGIAECWKMVARSSVTFPAADANNSAAYTSGATIDLPNGLFVANTVPVCSLNIIGDSNGVQTVAIKSISNTQIDFWYMSFYGINNTHTYNLGISVCAVGRWK